jgi:hypothetical protein
VKKVQTALHWVVVVSAASHVFCCVLPTLFALVSLLTGLGMLSSMPAFESIHEIMHDYETHILVFAAVVLFIGWAVQYYSWRIDCHDTGCAHGPCKPKKRKAGKLLLLATALFVINVFVLMLAH